MLGTNAVMVAWSPLITFHMDQPLLEQIRFAQRKSATVTTNIYI
jgi:hypothetical protein